MGLTWSQSLCDTILDKSFLWKKSFIDFSQLKPARNLTWLSLLLQTTLKVSLETVLPKHIKIYLMRQKSSRLEHVTGNPCLLPKFKNIFHSCPLICLDISINGKYLKNTWDGLNHIRTMFTYPLKTPENLWFSGCTKWEHWPEIG